MSWIGSTLLWLAWTALLLAGGFVALLCVAFGGDDPSHKRRAEWLVNITICAWIAAAVGSFWLMSHRSGAWMTAGALAATLAHLPIVAVAIVVLYRRR